MTSIMIGFSRAVHRLGTVYGNYSLDSQATGINAAGPNGGGSGDSTISLPASPYTNQLITINNTGTGTVTVNGNGNNIGSSATTTIATDTSMWLAWGGYSWGSATSSTNTLPATYDFGTTASAASATPYSLPANTITYENIGYSPYGGLFRKIITTTYAVRGPTSAEGGGGYTYTNAVGVSGILVASAAAVWAGFYASMPNLTVWSFWNVCPTINQPGGDHLYAYNEPSYDAPDVDGNITIRDTTMRTAIAGHDITCAEVAGRVSVPFAVDYLTNYSRVVAFAANAYYLDTHIVWTYEIV